MISPVSPSIASRRTISCTVWPMMSIASDKRSTSASSLHRADQSMGTNKAHNIVERRFSNLAATCSPISTTDFVSRRNQSNEHDLNRVKETRLAMDGNSQGYCKRTHGRRNTSSSRHVILLPVEGTKSRRSILDFQLAEFGGPEYPPKTGRVSCISYWFTLSVPKTTKAGSAFDFPLVGSICCQDPQ